MNDVPRRGVVDARGDTFIRTLLPDVRGLPRSFWVLFGAAAVDRIGGFVIPFLSIYLTVQRGLSIATAGIVISAFSVGGLFGSPVGGVLSDRLGRRPLLVGSWVLVAAALAHLATARTPTHIALAVLLLGVAGSLGRPAMSAAIADVVPERDRARAYGLHYWVINLGFAVAAVLSGPLLSLSYAFVFALDAATSLVAALFIYALLPEPRAHTPASSTRRIDLSVLSDRAFLAVFFGGVVTSVLFGQGHVALASEIARDGMPSLYGPIVAVNGVMIVLLQPLAVRVCARFSMPRVLAFSSTLLGLGFFATAFADSVLAHVCAVVTWTAGELGLAATTPVVLGRLAPPERRGTYQGFFQLSWSVGAFGPALGAWVLDAHGSLPLWGGCLALALTAAIVQARITDARLHE